MEGMGNIAIIEKSDPVRGCPGRIRPEHPRR